MQITTSPTPRWLTYKDATRYCGLSDRTLLTYEGKGLIKVANVIIPGATRGRKLIDRESLDALFESSVGNVTTASICWKGGSK